MVKRGLFFRRNCGLMWHNMAHVAEPREPTRTVAGRGHVAHGGHVAKPRESTRTPAWRLSGKYSLRVDR